MTKKAKKTVKKAVSKKGPTKRWSVTVRYACGWLPTDCLDIEELGDLHDKIEGGPDWNLLKDIVITYNYSLRRR